MAHLTHTHTLLRPTWKESLITWKVNKTQQISHTNIKKYYFLSFLTILLIIHIWYTNIYTFSYTLWWIFVIVYYIWCSNDTSSIFCTVIVVWTFLSLLSSRMMLKCFLYTFWNTLSRIVCRRTKKMKRESRLEMWFFFYLVFLSKVFFLTYF